MRFRIFAISALLVGLVACGVPKSGEFRTIDRAKIPEGLTATTTTTTTTTTTLPDTTTTIEEASTTTVAEATTTVAKATTTTIFATELVPLYFVAGRRLEPFEVSLPRNPGIAIVMESLISSPNGIVGLRSAIPAGSLIDANVDDRGVVTVNLPRDFFDPTNFQDPRFDPKLSIAQIVLTLTELRGISQVRFTEDDQPTQVILADGSSSEAGQVLYHADFESLLSGSPAGTTVPTTTTTTTPPPPETTSTTIGTETT